MQFFLQQMQIPLQTIITNNRIENGGERSFNNIIKKGDKKDPNNYRGTNSLKLTTGIITTKINERTSLQEEQKGFWARRFCPAAVLTIRKIKGKSLGYNKQGCYTFTVRLDEIIKKVEKRKSYKKGIKEIKIICYVDTAILIAQNEDVLQKLLKQFESFQRKKKNKTIVTSAELTSCKQVIITINRTSDESGLFWNVMSQA